jgi:hypothetical protein
LQQKIIDFLSGLSKSIIQGFSEALKNGGISNSIEEGMRRKGLKCMLFQLNYIRKCGE